MPLPSLLTSDPRAGYQALRAEIDAAIREVLDGPAYILGETVARFEGAFASFCGAGFGVGVNNGTDALHLALRALGIGAGHEVITVSHTAVATVASIHMAGATPVLADVEPRSRTIDPAAVEALLSPRTKAIIAVHLYGQPADIEAMQLLCAKHGLLLIEDCAQAHAAEWKGKRVGGFGDAAAFSFYPTKNLGAIGDAGMVLTSDAGVAERLRLLRQYGWRTPQHSELRGWNSRLDPLQAAILSVKLKHLDAHTARRRAIAKRYTEQLKELPINLPTTAAGCTHAFHLYVIEAADQSTRDGLRADLVEGGILAGIHYPEPVHVQPAYSDVMHGPMPVSERLARTVLSLPLYPEMTDADADRVIIGVRSYFNRHS
ncbi:MAG TPA: DegT/DnrJ/EryC1/StrS family aminotransferase [Flavobacteriales bacterium]|nr:DegT/DnrJ/EryC1/StrS family aminotransferase [Flavobacteriales bacterium]